MNKELAYTTAYIIRQDLLCGSFFQTFDKAWGIANKFIKLYPPDYKWIDEQWDETLEKFVNES